MQRGDVVLVRAYPDKVLERKVIEVGETYIAVCRPDVYEQALNEGWTGNLVMGFPKEDVVLKQAVGM